MRAVATGFVMMALAMAATPAMAIVMINEPARQPAACFDSAIPCEPQAEVAVPGSVSASANSELPSPLIPAVVGMLALGLAFVRRQAGMQEVPC